MRLLVVAHSDGVPVALTTCARRRSIREETCLTVSIGVSFSKIFAKLGSDMKKPDAVTVISRENFREKVWPLAVSELLYVGPATTRKLTGMNVLTIGDLAKIDPELLRYRLGKNGIMLWRFANGADHSPVMPAEFVPPIKSVGHRLRKNDLAARGVQITVKDNELSSRQYQAPLPFPSQSPLEIAQAGFELFRQHYFWDRPVRALTIRGINLVSANQPVQLYLFCNAEAREKRRALDDCVDEIRCRFGNRAIYAASLMGDLKMAQDKCETVMMPGLMYQ